MKIDNKELKARPLSWTERDALIEAGLDVVYNPVNFDNQVEYLARVRKIMSFILKEVFKLTDKELNAISDKDATTFAREVMELTYKEDAKTEKN